MLQAACGSSTPVGAARLRDTDGEGVLDEMTRFGEQGGTGIASEGRIWRIIYRGFLSAGGLPAEERWSR